VKKGVYLKRNLQKSRRKKDFLKNVAIIKNSIFFNVIILSSFNEYIKIDECAGVMKTDCYNKSNSFILRKR